MSRQPDPPRFIESFATQQLLPPFSSEGVTVHAFLFRLSVKVIQDYCDRFLNLGDPRTRPYHYMSLKEAPIGVLAISHYPVVSSRAPQDPIHGIEGDWNYDVRQDELYAAAPVLRYSIQGDQLVDPQLEWVQPFIVCNNATSAFSGREILGLETLYGEFKFDETADKSICVSTSLPSWRVFRPDSPQEILPFLSARTGPPMTEDEAKALAEQFAADPASVADLMALEAAIPDLERVAAGLFPATMRMVILKQFREAGDPSKAIYQALVSADCRYTRIREVKEYAPDGCCLQFTPGAMVDEIIGTLLDIPTAELDNSIKPGSSAQTGGQELVVRMAFSFTADIAFDAIDTIHKFFA
jgi:hypothetical protein